MSGCGKIQHQSKAEAKADLKAMRRRGRADDQEVYHCIVCEAWHVGRRFRLKPNPCRYCGVRVMVLPPGHSGPRQLRTLLVDAETETIHRCPGTMPPGN